MKYVTTDDNDAAARPRHSVGHKPSALTLLHLGPFVSIQQLLASVSAWFINAWHRWPDPVVFAQQSVTRTEGGCHCRNYELPSVRQSVCLSSGRPLSATVCGDTSRSDATKRRRALHL